MVQEYELVPTYAAAARAGGMAATTLRKYMHEGQAHWEDEFDIDTQLTILQYRIESRDLNWDQVQESMQSERPGFVIPQCVRLFRGMDEAMQKRTRDNHQAIRDIGDGKKGFKSQATRDGVFRYELEDKDWRAFAYLNDLEPDIMEAKAMARGVSRAAEGMDPVEFAGRCKEAMAAMNAAIPKDPPE
jgi:hypothetical protein